MNGCQYSQSPKHVVYWANQESCKEPELYQQRAKESFEISRETCDYSFNTQIFYYLE